MSDANLQKWSSRVAGWIRVAGEDAATYLQSQFSNDLGGSQDRPSTYGLFLSLKGKVRADAFICQSGAEQFDVVSYNCPSDELFSLLEENVIADEVEFAVQTVGASYVVAAEAAPEVPAGGLVFPGRRMLEPHFDILLPEGSGSTPDMELERLRIQAGIPAVPMDAGPDELPQEAGLEAVAVSFDKGCYLGQEVMARLKAMGRVQRRLYRVCGAGETPPCHTPVHHGDKPAGELRSTIAAADGGWLGFALLRRRFVEAAEPAGWSLSTGDLLTVGEALGCG